MGGLSTASAACLWFDSEYTHVNLMLGAFLGGSKYSSCCLREVENCLLAGLPSGCTRDHVLRRPVDVIEDLARPLYRVCERSQESGFDMSSFDEFMSMIQRFDESLCMKGFGQYVDVGNNVMGDSEQRPKLVARCQTYTESWTFRYEKVMEDESIDYAPLSG